MSARLRPERAAACFWRNVDKSGECWLWMRSLDSSGYGRFQTGLKRHIAHRFAWLITNGPIADGLCVCHHCDNPRCVRPDHLFLGTQADNIRDMIAKGRSPMFKQTWAGAVL